MTAVPIPSPTRREPAAAPACHDEVCITCSDTAVPVRVTALLDGGLAAVDTGASIEEVSVALVDATVGDVVLVHAKEAIAVLPPAESSTAEPATVAGPDGPSR